MTRFEARDQVRLSLYKCFEVCVHGVYYRLFRSLVTVSIVVLTVAFFSNVVLEGLLIHGVARGVGDEFLAMRRDARFVSKLTQLESVDELLDRLARTASDSPAARELIDITDLDPGSVADILTFAGDLRTYRSFFDDELTYGRRRILVAGKAGLEVFTWLQAPANWDQFVGKLETLRSVHVPGELPDLQSFLAVYPERMRTVRQIQDAYRNAVETIAERYPVPELKHGIITQAPELRQFLIGLGFRVPEDDWRLVAAQLEETEKRLALSRTFQNFTFKTRFISRYGILAKEYSDKAVMNRLRKDSGVEWFVRQVNDLDIDLPFEAAEIPSLARSFLKGETLREVERALQSRGDWSEGIDRKTLWLMAVSFVVCTVGITNAMLISVAERFREIATMKCLGAMDSFVMILFVMEAGLFGLAGGFLGVILGFLLSILKLFMTFGQYTFTYFAAPQMFMGVGGSLVLGMLIATVAALYPSWVASRMAPMEAMRVE